ncbi:hypothetical protein ARMSODRAFT_953807, partial [Armillaria solidipes]
MSHILQQMAIVLVSISLNAPLAVPGPRCCVASRDVTEHKGSHVTPALGLNLHNIQLMGLDAPLLQLLAPCTDSRTSPRRFSHDDYSVITKAASPTILTCTRRDATL